MKTWNLAEAEGHLADLVDRAQHDGPQVVADAGEPRAVVVSYAQWNKLSPVPPRSLVELLLAPEPRCDLELPDRHAWTMRPPPDFD